MTDAPMDMDDELGDHLSGARKTIRLVALAVILFLLGRPSLGWMKLCARMAR